MQVKVAQLAVDQGLISINNWIANTVLTSIVAVVPINSTTLIIFYT